MYYESLEKDAIIFSNQAQIEKLIQLNETLLHNNQIVPLATEEKIPQSYFPYFELPSISASGVMTVVVAVVFVGGSILLFSQIPSSTGINGIVKDSVSQAIVDLQKSSFVNSGDIVSKVNDHTLKQFDLAQHADTQAATRILSYLSELDKKVGNIEHFLDGVARGVYNSTSSSLSKPNVIVDTLDKAVTEVVKHGPEIATKISKFSDIFGSSPPPGV